MFLRTLFILPVKSGILIYPGSSANLCSYQQMADLKEQIELEVQAAREEYVKMESHIRLYINEMEQGLSGI